MPIPDRRCTVVPRVDARHNRRFPVIAISTLALAVACSGSSPQGPLEAKIPTTLQIEPGAVEIAPGEAVRFQARVRDGRGSNVPAEVFWSATGGTISQRGVYTAGDALGSFSVHAQVQEQGVSLATSAAVVIVDEPTETSHNDTGSVHDVSISPSAITLFPGAKTQFSADVKDASGNTLNTGVTWKTTGGQITSNGRLTAASTAGSYTVTAKAGNSRGNALVVVVEPTSSTGGDSSDPPSTSDPEPAPVGTPALFVSLSADRSEAVALEDGGVLTSGTAYVFAELIDGDGLPMTEPEIASCELSMGSTSNTEAFWPYDLGGGSLTTANPVSLASGSTVVEATFTMADGSSITVSADVTVEDTPESDPEPSPDPDPEPSPDPASGVEVFPGESIQSAVDAHPEGTTFVLKSGTHRRQSIEPRNGNTFLGEQGTVLDGEGVAEFAFLPTGDNVTIRGLKVTNYNNPLQMGAIHAGGHGKRESTGWIVANNEVSNNAGAGVRTSNTIHVIGNHVHHNGQIGITGRANNSLIENNEIAYNNTRGIDPGWEAGGTKFVHSDGLIIRGNHSHHNDGPGLWTDMNNINILYEDNLVEHNAGTGIFHEVSYKAIIRNNTVRNNGHQRGRWMYGAGILVAHSSDVEVHGNFVENNFVGIAGIDQNRRNPSDEMHGPWTLKNLWVHDNELHQPDSWRVAGLNREDGALDSYNLHFDRNKYTISRSSEFELNGGLSPDEWKASGHDQDGVFIY